MGDTRKTYYDLLGVAPSCGQDELRSAFRKKAMENHPDRIGNLPVDEQEQRKQIMYQVNEAWGTLSDPDKRREYDESLRSPVRPNHEGQPTTPSNTTRTESYKSYEVFWREMNEMLRTFSTELFRETTSRGGYTTRTRPAYSSHFKQDDEFKIPENDWGLLVALKKAYEAKSDGEWRVKKAETDIRTLSPDELYTVKREGENVTVGRKITDWRYEFRRNQPIGIRVKDGFRIESTLPADTFLDEKYLSQKGRMGLDDWSAIPIDYGDYLGALKNLAQKFAKHELNKDGNYDIGDEISMINRYSDVAPKLTREKRGTSSLYASYEYVEQVPFNDFWRRMKQAEDRVFTAEGRIKPEGNKPSGEGYR